MPRPRARPGCVRRAGEPGRPFRVRSEPRSSTTSRPRATFPFLIPSDVACVVPDVCGSDQDQYRRGVTVEHSLPLDHADEQTRPCTAEGLDGPSELIVLTVTAWAACVAGPIHVSGQAAEPRRRPGSSRSATTGRSSAGEPVRLWGLRCGNALHSRSVTERHVNCLDMMAAHGINLIGVYIQGTNGGFPNPDAGFDGFRRDGRLKPEVAERLEWLIREADRRGMVVMVGLLSPRKDQDLYDEAADPAGRRGGGAVPRRAAAPERLRRPGARVQQPRADRPRPACASPTARPRRRS